MENSRNGSQVRFRVWAAGYENWRPSHCGDVPPQATAIEPIDEECLDAGQAQAMVESFNQKMLTLPNRLWAVAIPVAICIEGDARTGALVHGHNFPCREA